MVIKNSDGSTYKLKGPNKLKRSNFWNFDNIKYFNFKDYGQSILLNFKKNNFKSNKQENDIETKKEKFNINNFEIKEQKSLFSTDIENKDFKPDIIIKNDDYLDEYSTKKRDIIKIYKPEEIFSQKHNNINDYNIAGSIITFISTKNIKTRFYAIFDEEIIENAINRTAILDKFQTNIENIEKNGTIYCEWDDSYWKISSIKLNNDQIIINLKD